VTWTASVVTGEYVVTSYKVYAGDVLQETVAAPLTTTVGTFSGGTVVRVSAVNAIGEGSKSSPVTITTVPGAPTISQAFYDPSEGGTNVTWQAPASDGGTPITGYVVYFDGDVYTPDTMVSSTHYRFAGNFSGSTVEVSAVNSVGEGPKSAPVTVVEA
jgi:titin